MVCRRELACVDLAIYASRLAGHSPQRTSVGFQLVVVFDSVHSLRHFLLFVLESSPWQLPKVFKIPSSVALP
jgi:hypothetical protein